MGWTQTKVLVQYLIILNLFIYLSDLDYINSLSSTDSPHPIRKNRNPDGNIITLQINDDGTTKQ